MVSLDPGNVDALYYYAVSLWDRDSTIPSDTVKAELLLKKAVAIKPAFAAGHLQLGIVYAAQGDYDNAIKHLRSATRLNPNSTTARYHLAQA